MSDEIDQLSTEKEQTIKLSESLAAEFDKLESEDRERDEKGRFKPKEDKEEHQEAKPQEQDTAVEETPAEETPDQGSEPKVEPETSLSPPDRWSAEWKTQFTTLPREAQQLLLDRESEYAKGFDQKSQEAATLKRQLEPIEQILSQRRQQFAMQGMNEVQGLTQLFTLSDFAANDPAGFIKMFAQGRGIDLASLTKPGEQPIVPPELNPVMQKVTNLEQYILNQQQQQVNSVIESFSKDHPYFNECSNEVTALIPAIKAENPGISQSEILQKAYDRATWANPVVRQKLLDAEKANAEAARKADEAKRIAEAKAAATKAKKAAGTQLTSKASLNGGVAAPSTMKETLYQTYDQLHGAA